MVIGNELIEFYGYIRLPITNNQQRTTINDQQTTSNKLRQMKKISILSLLSLFINFGGFAQLYSNFPVTEEKSAIDPRMIGIWDIMPKEPVNIVDENTVLKSEGFIIITSVEDNFFKMQILNKQMDESRIYYNSTEYMGYVSVLENQYFLNLQEIEQEEENQDEDEDDFNSDSERGYYIFKLEMTKGSFNLKTPITPSNKSFSTQSAFTDYVRKNMLNSFFYQKDADYAYNTMVPLKLK